MQRPAWLGKLLGLTIGFLALGPFGAVAGFLIGSVYDGLYRFKSMVGPAMKNIQGSFFETTFLLMGRLAKADGVVTRDEIRVAEELMRRMGLNADRRREAIELFNRGKSDEFDMNTQLDQFMAACSAQPNLRQMLLVFLFSMAHADGSVSTEEHNMLQHVAARLGFSRQQFEQLLSMFHAQDRFSQPPPGSRERRHSINDAYAALGVDASASDSECKKAYRKLMSQHHPDKLISEGVPEEMIKIATERSQEIQNAWEQIRKVRGI